MFTVTRKDKDLLQTLLMMAVFLGAFLALANYIGELHAASFFGVLLSMQIAMLWNRVTALERELQSLRGTTASEQPKTVEKMV